jgi:hypothetical protein
VNQITDEIVNVAHALAEDRRLRRWFMGLEALSPSARTVVFREMSERMAASGEPPAMVAAISALASSDIYAAVRQRARELDSSNRPTISVMIVALLVLALAGVATRAFFRAPSSSDHQVPTRHRVATRKHYPLQQADVLSRRPGDWPEPLDGLWWPLYTTPLGIRAVQKCCSDFAEHSQPEVVIPDMVADLTRHPFYEEFSIYVAVMELWPQATVRRILMPYQYSCGGRHFESLMPPAFQRHDTGESDAANQLAADVINKP